MRHIKKFAFTLQGFTGTLKRFPVSILFFILSAVITSYSISAGFDDYYFKFLFFFLIGAAVFMVLQLYIERFAKSKKARFLAGITAVSAAVAYYLILEFTKDELGTDTVIRTVVLLFVLLISFIWIPAVKSKFDFSDSFMAFFKSFFTVAFYSGVMFLGIALIFMAIDMLIVNVDSKAYSHVLNIIAFVYAPLHFLSLIPVYPGFAQNGRKEINENTDVNVIGENMDGRLKKAIEPSKFLEGLVSYIIIPITVVFTFILLLYIVLNITGDFWKDNLMESLLVAYSITVITVYLLAYAIKNRWAGFFRKIFPKVLIPVVLFQTISSVLKIGELGITAGRYYVIMFGIFATVTAFIFSIRPKGRTNIIAPILIVLSLISVIPPTDAFSVSRKNQISRLTRVLEENNMLKDGQIIPNEDISQDDKRVIVNSVQYLNRMNYAKDIGWLKDYSRTYDFEKTFGFPQYGTDIKEPTVFRFYLPTGVPLEVSGFDYLVEAEFYGQEQQMSYEISFGENKEYLLTRINNGGIGELLLTDSGGNELIRFPLDNVYERYKDRDENTIELTPDDARFITENEKAVLCLVAKNVDYEEWDDSVYRNIEALVMIKIK